MTTNTLAGLRAEALALGGNAFYDKTTGITHVYRNGVWTLEVDDVMYEDGGRLR